MATAMPSVQSREGRKLTGVIYGSYFLDELLPWLDERAKMDGRVTLEWHQEQKYPLLLDLDNKFDTIDVLHTDTYEGPIHDWCLGYIRQRRPDIVMLMFGNVEMCDLGASIYHVASRVHQLAQTLLSDDFKVGYVMCLGAIPLVADILCGLGKYRKRVFGFNTKLTSFASGRIATKRICGFWKDEHGNKVEPSVYAPDSFIPGPDPESFWFRKYVHTMWGAMIQAVAGVHANDAFQAMQRQ